MIKVKKKLPVVLVPQHDGDAWQQQIDAANETKNSKIISNSKAPYKPRPRST